MELGVIGGMGSEATSYYFEQLVAHTDAEKDQNHIDTIILNTASLPDRTSAILNKNTEDLLKKLIEHVELLEEIKVKNIAIPCNTAHYFYDIIQEKVSVPIIHMIRETIKYAINNFENVKKVGIMATDGTIDARVYHNECKKLGIEVVIPSKNRQAGIMSLIYDDIKQGKEGDILKFQRAYEELMVAGSDVVVLACTELSVFKKSIYIFDNCIDAMDILVKESILRSNVYYK